ncbi:MAG TPA: DUF2637 domain-containing protein [Nocardioidaceae bacterium]
MTTDLAKVEIERERLAYKRERRAERQAIRAQRQAARKATRTERTTRRRDYWSRFTTNLPLRLALLGVAGVWLLGCLWSFREQTALAAASGFETPWVLPLLVDGFAASCAGVAYAASLDGRAAVAARAMTGLAVGCSASSNGLWAWERSHGYLPTVTLAVGVPLVANLAFEVLLGERRRVVKRRRGLPAPRPVEPPRLVRLMLSPLREFWAWRRRTLTLTAPPLVATDEASTDSSSSRLGAALVAVLEALAARLRRSGSTSSTATEHEPGTAEDDASAAAGDGEVVENAEPVQVGAATVTSPQDEATNERPWWAVPFKNHDGTPQRVWRLEKIIEELEAGAELDGPRAGALVGVSARQGQRDLNVARKELARRRAEGANGRVTPGEPPRLVSVRSAGEGN